jgi:hypothetical protein
MPMPPSSTTAIDWDRVAAWTELVLAGDLAPVAAVFRTHASDPPELTWSPGAERMVAPPLAFLASAWDELTRDAPLPHIRQIDPFRLRPALGHIMLIEPVEDGRDFRYRLYGSIIAGISKLDMTGRFASEHPASPHVTELSIATYRAQLRRPEPVYMTRNPQGAKHTRRWQRLALPFVDDSGRIARFLCGTVAVGFDGRMLEG